MEKKKQEFTTFRLIAILGAITILILVVAAFDEELSVFLLKSYSILLGIGLAGYLIYLGIKG